MKMFLILYFAIIHMLYAIEEIQNNPLSESSAASRVNEFVPHEFNPELPVNLYQLVHDFQSIMQLHGIPFFFSSGTLLGAVRHKGLIPWDDDIDCCLLFENIDDFIHNAIPVLKSLDYTVNYYDAGWRGFQIKKKDVNGDIITYLDVFFMQMNEKLGKYVYPTGWPDMRLTKDEIFPLQLLRFGNLSIQAPKDYLKFLRLNFGPRCLTHIRKYNHLFSLPIKGSEYVECTDKLTLPAGPFAPLIERHYK